MTRPLTDGEFVDWVRAAIGLRPLRERIQGVPHNAVRFDGTSTYLRLERLRRLADPDCTHCGGSGYFDGEAIGMTCDCTRRAR